MSQAAQNTCFKPLTSERGETQHSMAQLVSHLDAAYNLARWLVRDEMDVEDVVQDAYVRAFRYLHTLRRGESRSWLLAIVRNACYDRLRRGQVDSQTADASVERCETETPSPETILLRKTETEALHDAIDGLPPDLREVLVLREWEGMPYKDIAQITGVPSGTVMSRLWRARQQLQQSFGSRSQIGRACTPIS